MRMRPHSIQSAHRERGVRDAEFRYATATLSGWVCGSVSGWVGVGWRSRLRGLEVGKKGRLGGDGWMDGWNGRAGGDFLISG